MDVRVSNDQLMEQHGFIPMNHTAPQFFPVKEGRLYDESGGAIPAWKRIFREDTGDTLGIHSESYSLVPYETHFDAFERAIERSGLPLGGLRVGTDMSDNGARIFRQYLFPEVTANVDNQILALRIVMFDSYNGSSAFIGKTGFFNFACANTSFFGKSLVDIRFRHVGEVEKKVQDAADRLTVTASDFIEEMKRLESWPAIPVDTLTATVLLQKLPQGNRRLTDELTARFAREGGRHLWDFHNMLTSWATHGVPAKTSNERNKRILDLVEGMDWRALEPV